MHQPFWCFDVLTQGEESRASSR